MNIHVLGLPHIQVTQEYCRDAYGMKILKFCNMMVDEGHTVTVYAGEDNESKAELVTCITKKEQAKLGFSSPDDYLKNTFDPNTPLWQIFHQRAIYEMGKRVKKGDIIGNFGAGRCDKEVKDAFPQAYFVELGVGYSGVFADFRVYESQAWLHTVKGASTQAHNANGDFYHTVIPNYFNPDEFPLADKVGDYFLYVGRMISRKGLKIIEAMAERMPDTRFVLAGQGGTQKGNVITGQDVVIKRDNLEYIGMLNVEQRGKWMSEARALIVPTVYIPPFEGVAVEAMMCGTPIITTPFGAFTEYNIDGVTGYQCHTIKEFVEACGKVDGLKRQPIRTYAQGKFSLEVCAKQYTRYFERLQGLSRGGFYEK